MVRLAIASCLLGVAVRDARAQATDTRALEEAAARKVVRLWQLTDNETVRKQAAGTLRQMGAEMAPILAKLLNEELDAARAESTSRTIHLATVKLMSDALGRHGNLLVREETVRSSLLAIVKDEAGLPADVRQIAIEALGRIYAGRSVFLILNREEFWLKFQVAQRTPREMAQYLQNEAATLKDKFAKTPDAKRARELILVTRNVGRKIRLYRNVIALLNELEPPQDKTLSERIAQDLANIESNLQAVAAGGSSAAEAGGRAEQAANDLYEDLEHTAYSILRWQEFNRATGDVIAGLQPALDDADLLVRYSAVEALGRIYGKRDW